MVPPGREVLLVAKALDTRRPIAPDHLRAKLTIALRGLNKMEALMTNEQDDKMPERHRSFFAEINEGCLRRIDRAAVPILGIQNDKIVHDRLGGVVSDRPAPLYTFCCTRFAEIVEANIPSYVSMNRPGVQPLSLADAKFVSTEETVRDVSAICPL